MQMSAQQFQARLARCRELVVDFLYGKVPSLQDIKERRLNEEKSACVVDNDSVNRSTVLHCSSQQKTPNDSDMNELVVTSGPKSAHTPSSAKQ